MGHGGWWLVGLELEGGGEGDIERGGVGEGGGAGLDRPTRTGTATRRIQRTEGRFWTAVSSNMVGGVTAEVQAMQG